MEEKAIGKFENFLKSFVTFDKDAFEYSKQYFKIVTLQKGEYFVEAGKTCTNLGFIVSGFMRGFYIVNGVEKTICLSDKLFTTATRSFILQKPSEISIVAVEPAEILAISRVDLDLLYNKFDFWAKVGRVIMELEFIEIECRNRCFDKLTPEEKYLTLVNENPGITNRVPLYIIASFLGITPETLSRIRRKIIKQIQ